MTYYILKLIDQIYNGQVGDLLDPAHRNLKVIDLAALLLSLTFLSRSYLSMDYIS